MELILDVTRVVRRLIKGQTLTGIDRVTMAYVGHYQKKAQALVRWCGRSWILSSQHSKALFAWLEKPKSSLRVRIILLQGIVCAKKSARKNNFLLNTGHIGLNQSDYLRFMHQSGVKPIFLVHDLIPITYPEYCSIGEDLRHQEKINQILQLAQGIVTNSQATLDDLRHYAQQKHLSLTRTKVATLAPGLVMQAPGERPIKKPYFVLLSTIEPRKNHLLVLHIWRKLYQNLGQQTPHLFVIGQRGWECEGILDLLDRSQLLKEVVTEISACPDAHLITYIHHSQALLFPSFAEGYGLPLIEALALGVPVIASNLAVFREIADDIPEYIDPLDGKHWEEMIREYTHTNSTRRMAQLVKIKNFKTPSWKEHFQKVDSFLAEL